MVEVAFIYFRFGPPNKNTSTVYRNLKIFITVETMISMVDNLYKVRVILFQEEYIIENISCQPNNLIQSHFPWLCIQYCTHLFCGFD